MVKRPSSPSKSEVYFVDAGNVAYGPWQSRPVADLVARIINMDESQDAEVNALDLDSHASNLISGLRPFKISITKQGKTILDKQISLCWPPEEESCKLREEEGIVEYFVWAKTQTEAYSGIARLSTQSPKYRPIFESSELPLEGAEESI